MSYAQYQAEERQRKRELRDPAIHLFEGDVLFGDTAMRSGSMQFSGYEPYGVRQRGWPCPTSAS